MKTINFAVNGTLMRGLALNRNLLDAGAQFLCEAQTSACYRLWSINDDYPAMLRDDQLGASIALEIWQLSPDALVRVLQQEPAGLTIGRVELADGSSVLGVLAEPWLYAGQPEITAWGGWRAYLAR